MVEYHKSPLKRISFAIKKYFHLITFPTSLFFMNYHMKYDMCDIPRDSN